MNPSMGALLQPSGLQMPEKRVALTLLSSLVFEAIRKEL